MEPVIRDIADTARWVAVFRAEESERSDAIFRDPYARRLAGDRGQQIASAIEFSRANSWSFVARTYLYDAAIERHIAEGFETILNLGAGLDTRPYRMKLPSSLHWIEADLPATITYKDAMLAGERPACRLDRISVDLADREARVALFERVCDRARNVLVVTEGLIVYLTEEEVGSLAVDLSRQPSFRRWALDLVSPGLLARAQAQMASVLDAGGTPLKFGPPQGEEFFRRYGWQPLESRSLLKTAAVLNRLSPQMMEFASLPEPDGPKGEVPWSGVCQFENTSSASWRPPLLVRPARIG
jgi:methyltransferase (TIGR00027 family)